MLKRIEISFFILIVFFLGVYFLIHSGSVPLRPLVRFQNVGDLKIEVAEDYASQERGLSGRLGIAEDEIMLFVFPAPARHDFWMKDMNFAIDMIWLDENGKIIYIEKNADPKSYPKTFGPNADSKWVIETASGFAERHNIKVGDPVVIGYH